MMVRPPVCLEKSAACLQVMPHEQGRFEGPLLSDRAAPASMYAQHLVNGWIRAQLLPAASDAAKSCSALVLGVT